MRANLLQWQWSDYADKHRSRTNLLLHIVVIPLFQLATIALIIGIWQRSRWLIISAVISMLLSLILQGRGHGGEQSQPTPFSGALDFPTRFLAEQFITFPRFVLSGGWFRNLKNAR